MVAEAAARAGPAESALVLGAGTSALSEALVADGVVQHVLSLDLEEHCVDIMATKHRGDARLAWAVADVTDWASVGAATKGRTFDLVVDKGTLDALLCVGDCASYLATIARTARSGGALVLVSLHGPTFVQKLLDLQTLWSRPVAATWTRPLVSAASAVERSFHATVFARNEAPAAKDLDMAAISRHLEDVLEWHHHEACPLLSAERERSIRASFQAAAAAAAAVGPSTPDGADSASASHLASPGRLALAQVYDLLFTPEEKSCYSYDYFEQDAEASRQMRELEDRMSLQEALTFLRINQ